MRVTIDGQVVEAERPGQSILEAAAAAGIYVPSLCAYPGLPAQQDHAAAPAVFWGNQRLDHVGPSRDEDGCGICVVDVDGEQVAACATAIRAGMIITTQSEALSASRRERLATILATHPHACLTCTLRDGCAREPCSMNVPQPERCCSQLGSCELQALAAYVGIEFEAKTPRYRPAADASLRFEDEPLFVRDQALCVACGRCARACHALGIDALGWVRGADGHRRVGPLAPTPIAAGCQLCGVCVEVCPTGALRDSSGPGPSNVPPCRDACPAGTDVPRTLRFAAQGRWDDAAATIAERAPLVEVLGYVCYRPCESACRRGEVNAAPLAIRDVKRRIGSESGAGWVGRLPEPLPPSGRTIAVVGAGPAGLVAAFTLRLFGHRVTLYDRQDKPGGLLQWGIPPFRLPREVVDREVAALVDGVELRLGVRVGGGAVTVSGLRRAHDAVLVATGAAQSLTLDVAGASLPGVLCGIEFLQQAAIGTADCSGSRVVVIGGGDVAIDCARSALRLGAASVALLCIERIAEMPAQAVEVEQALREGVVVHDEHEVARFDGDDVALRAVGARRACSAPGEMIRELAADLAIVAIGQRVDHSILPEGLGAGVFLAGDVARSGAGPSSVIEALASGRRAALEIDRFLGGSAISLRLVPDEAPTKLKLNGGSTHRKTHVQFAALPRLDLGPCGEGARQEAARCLRCDLRQRYRARPAAPAEVRVALCEANLAQVPAASGVIRFFSAGTDEPLEIVGAPDMRREAAARLNALAEGQDVTFVVEPCTMYTQRQNELLSQHLARYGQSPPGVGEDEDLDDLY